MKCSCCGKKKRFLESFEELNDKVHVCVECSKKLYKYQDFKRENNTDEAELILSEIISEKNTPDFSGWLTQFMLRFEKEKPKSKATKDKKG